MGMDTGESQGGCFSLHRLIFVEMETDLHAGIKDRDAEHRLHHGIHRRDDGAEEVCALERGQVPGRREELREQGDQGREGRKKRGGERETKKRDRISLFFRDPSLPPRGAGLSR